MAEQRKVTEYRAVWEAEGGRLRTEIYFDREQARAALKTQWPTSPSWLESRTCSPWEKVQ